MRYSSVIIVLCVALVFVGTASAWYDYDWNYRKSFTINNTCSNLTDYQVAFTVNRSAGSDSGFAVYLDGKCAEDYDDIRFVGDDDATEWDYWIESSSSTVATIWVEVPSIPNSTAYGSTTGYLYYGNSGASAASNGTNTFPLFDDFLGSSIDAGKWDTSGTVTVSGGVVVGKISSKSTYGDNYSLRCRGKIANTAISHYLVVWADSISIGSWAAYRTVVESSVWAKEKYPTLVMTNLAASHDTSYHVVEIAKVSTTCYFTKDSISDGTLTSCPSPTTITKVVNYDPSTTWDWILIRQYTATEPTISAWGSEEEAPAVSIVVDLTGAPTTGNVPLTVYFTNASAANNCTIDTWQWSFGDSTANATSQNPAHTYTTSGLFDVALTVSNTTFGVTNTTTKSDYINVTINPDAPTADFTVTETCGDIGETFYFIDFSTGGGLYAWNWSFGDGAYSELRNPTHQYAANGIYDVNLTVWGAYGVDSLERSNLITIPCGAPTPTPTTPTPTPTYIYGNISVYRAEPNYIIWRVSENITSICLDGENTNIYGEYYGQYGLEPNTKHFACVNGNECISTVTPDNGISVFGHWLIYIILIIGCIVALRVPISGVFSIVFGTYLIVVYLPSISAPFNEFVLTAVLMAMGLICSIVGLRR